MKYYLVGPVLIATGLNSGCISSDDLERRMSAHVCIKDPHLENYLENLKLDTYKVGNGTKVYSLNLRDGELTPIDFDEIKEHKYIMIEGKLVDVERSKRFGEDILKFDDGTTVFCECLEEYSILKLGKNYRIFLEKGDYKSFLRLLKLEKLD